MRFGNLIHQLQMENLAEVIKQNNAKFVMLVDTSQPDDDFEKKMGQVCKSAKRQMRQN